MGSIYDWIPSLTSTGLLAIFLFFARNLIITRLTASVKHEYDQKLETFKSEIRATETDVKELQTGALENSKHRSAIIYSKELDAVDGLWSTVLG
ncbi:MAG: hypothetical protein NE327_18095 [Lentisphaeraceae bacterium]|nr:hypothetical protein [Lentisphaeraceae bacterium]